MSWDSGPAAGGGGQWDGGASYDEPAVASVNNNYGGDEGEGGGRSFACFNCGAEGHSKADCTEPAKPRACFNCGEEGHTSKECTNERVEREFTGTCRVCEQTGHRAKDCPSAPPVVCGNCGEPDHAQVECKNARLLDRSHIEDVKPEQAWEELKVAVKERDIDDVKAAIAKYVKAVPDTTYVQLEQAFRTQNIGLYIIGIEKELSATYTNMNFQGLLQRKFTATWRWSNKPMRPKEQEFWPASAEENFARLADAGEPVDCGMTKCSNCDKLGHTKRNCPEEINENTSRPEVKCFNCEGVGHRNRDCPNPRPDKFTCRNCGSPDHSNKDCPEPRSAENVECNKCNEMGHFSRDCPQGGGGGGGPRVCFNCFQEGHGKNDCTNEKVMKCRNCDGLGHSGKDCPEPKDWSRVQCTNCEEYGHTKVRCKAPPKAEEGGDGFGDVPGGGDDFGNVPAGGDEYGAVPGGDDFRGGGNSWESAPAPPPAAAGW